MSTQQNIDLATLNRVAKWHRERGLNLSTMPANSALAELFLDSGDAKVAVQKTAPKLHAQAVNSIEKKINGLAQGRSLPGASKLLRLRQRAQALGLNSEILTRLLQNEADRLIDRALVLSARHGAKARVRIATLSALTEAGFIESDDLNLVKTAIMTSDMVKDLLAKTNEEEALRFKAYIASLQTPLPAPKKQVGKRKPTIINSERRTNGTMPCKPLTKAAFLLSAGGGEKQVIKAEREAKAKARRLKSKASGGSKVGGPGEGVQVHNADLDLCAAGHVGTKVAK